MNLSARSSARVESAAAFQQLSSHEPRPTANDSIHVVSGKAKRVTGVRVAEVARLLSDDDRAVLATVARLRLVSGGQVQRLHGDGSASSDRRTRRRLARLVELGVLARLARRIGGVRAGSAGFVYALDVIGQRLVGHDGRPRHPWTPGVLFLDHSLRVAEVYVRLVEASRTSRLSVVGFDVEPPAWRSFVGGGGVRSVLKPDAFAVVIVGDYEDRWFIEVDCATAGATAITRKLKLYEDYWRHGREQITTGVFPKVLWLAPTVERVAVLRSLIEARPEDVQGLFAAELAENVVGVIEEGPQP